MQVNEQKANRTNKAQKGIQVKSATRTRQNKANNKQKTKQTRQTK